MARVYLITTIVFFCIQLCRAQFNPSILQDSRDLPKGDGTFGFLYRTEDGIAHAAKADPGGVVHGRFSYTDPTGLKVNYNYNAGSAVTPGYNYNAQPDRNVQPQQNYDRPQNAPVQNYEQPQNQPAPRRTRPPAARNYVDNYDNGANNYDNGNYDNNANGNNYDNNYDNNNRQNSNAVNNNNNNYYDNNQYY